MDVEIRELDAQPTIVLRGRVEIAGVGQFLQEAFGAVYGFLGLRGLAPVGMPFARYLAMAETEMEVEAGTAVAAPATGEGTVVASQLPGGPCAVTWHIGPFDTIAETYEALITWIADQGHVPGGPPWECYWTDPAEEPDSSKWRTEVFQPLASSA